MSESNKTNISLFEDNEKVIVQWGPHHGKVGYFQFECPEFYSNAIVLSPEPCDRGDAFEYNWFMVRKIDCK